MRRLAFCGVWTWVWRSVVGVVCCAGLVVLLVACAWWVRSYFAIDTARLQGRDGYLRVIIHRGAAHLTSYREELHGSHARLVFGTDDRPKIPDRIVQYVYPEDSRRREPEKRWIEHPGRAWERAIPLWAVAVTAGVLPAAWAVRRGRAKGGLPPTDRPPVRRRVGRFLVTASAWACLLSAAGWVETMRWRGFGLNWRTGVALLEMESTTGIGSLRVNAVWRPRPQPVWASHDDLQGWGRERPWRGIGAHRVWFPPETHIDSRGHWSRSSGRRFMLTTTHTFSRTLILRHQCLAGFPWNCRTGCSSR